MSLKRKVGNAVRSARNYASLTQQELGCKVGISKQAVSRIENGHILPSLETMISIAKHTGVTPDSITGHVESSQDISWLRERVERLEKSLAQNQMELREIAQIIEQQEKP